MLVYKSDGKLHVQKLTASRACHDLFRQFRVANRAEHVFVGSPMLQSPVGNAIWTKVALAIANVRRRGVLFSCRSRVWVFVCRSGGWFARPTTSTSLPTRFLKRRPLGRRANALSLSSPSQAVTKLVPSRRTGGGGGGALGADFAVRVKPGGESTSEMGSSPAPAGGAYVGSAGGPVAFCLRCCIH